MILHIGNNMTILKNNILVILDYKMVEESDSNRALVKRLIEDGKLVNKIDEDTKSFILTIEDKNKTQKELKLYTSNISSKTLLNRKMI